jgi:AcrR family transcriptional regulator
MVDARRAMVLNAARSVFEEAGLERMSIREIAKRAGYTPGAIYAFYDGKQELLAALLEEVFGRVTQTVVLARPSKARSAGLLHAKGLAWFSAFAGQPRDLELTLTLLGGASLHGLKAELVQRLHASLRRTLEPCIETLLALGATPAQANGELEALMAHGLGLLLVQNSLGLTAPEAGADGLFLQYLDRMATRLQPQGSVPGGEVKSGDAASQSALFG